MAVDFRPSSIGRLTVPGYDVAPHIVEMEDAFLRLYRGDYRRLLVSIPIRHGKSEYANCFISWLLLIDPRLRILRVMAAAKTAEMEAVHVIDAVEKYGPRWTGARISKRKAAVQHFQMEAGGELRSIGAEGDVESWTFDWIIIDDLITDPYEIRNPNRRTQIYNDLNTKFFSRVSPTGETKFVYIGSRRHPDDPPGRLLESSKDAPPDRKWHYHCRPAIFDEGTDHERCLWPTSKEFTLEKLKAIRDAKIQDGVAWEWHCNFQNDAISSPDMLAFDSSWFDPLEMFYDTPADALPPANNRVIAFDPSMGDGSETNDYFACLYIRFTSDGYLYVDDSYLAVAAPDTAVEMSIALCERHQDAQLVVFEANAGGRYIAKCIKDGLARRGLNFPVVYKNWSAGDQKLDNADDQGRITLALWEKLSNRKIKLRDTPWNRVLYRQLRGFPTEKLDGPDCLATADIVLKQILASGRR